MHDELSVPSTTSIPQIPQLHKCSLQANQVLVPVFIRLILVCIYSVRRSLWQQQYGVWTWWKCGFTFTIKCGISESILWSIRQFLHVAQTYVSPLIERVFLHGNSEEYRTGTVEKKGKGKNPKTVKFRPTLSDVSVMKKKTHGTHENSFRQRQRNFSRALEW